MGGKGGKYPWSCSTRWHQQQKSGEKTLFQKRPEKTLREMNERKEEEKNKKKKKDGIT